MGARRPALAAAVLGALLFAAPAVAGDPAPLRHDTALFASHARSIQVGDSRKRVRRLLGQPDDASGGTWSYRNPPYRPDGPYQTFDFTFVAGKVTKIDEGGVGCVYREYRE